MFEPASVAVFGASEREDSVGGIVFRNLLEGGYKGELIPVNPKHKQIHSVACLQGPKDLRHGVDLAVIATPAPTVVGILSALVDVGIKAVVVLSAGFAEAGEKGKAMQAEAVAIARRHHIRLLGPNCLGLLTPSIGLNASFAFGRVKAGDLALVSQSGAICTAILDWASPNQVGFSSVVSLGDAADVDFGDALDYLALDHKTKSILLYVEGVNDARRFMSGLRAAARIKPVIVVKAGRSKESTRAAISHTGALVAGDDVFDAALQRAGAVRTNTISRMFAAATVLSSRMRATGKHLAIVTNGGGPGVIATDRAVERGLQLAGLSEKTRQRLDEVLPAHWSHANPVDILGDATPERYADALTATLGDRGVDGVIVLLTPQAMTDPLGVAKVVVEAAGKTRKPVLAGWMGETQVREAWEYFSSHRLPCFNSPEVCVEAFAYLAEYHCNQQLLVQTPGPLLDNAKTDVAGARLIVEGVLDQGRTQLSDAEAKAVLAAFRIPVNAPILCRSANEALVTAETIGYPVVMKIQSPDIIHKTDVGGVRLNVSGSQVVRRAFQEMMEQVARREPGARLDGVTLEAMVVVPHARELMVGVLRDPAFGPVISFGAGGIAVEVLQDRTVALPPLNEFIIDNLLAGTRVHKLLDQFRDLPPVHHRALENALLRISDLVCELPEIVEMDINPLIASPEGVIAVDARIRVDRHTPGNGRYGHMAIHPYPGHLEETWQLSDGTEVTIRPIRPEDADIEQAFVRGLSQEARYFRFLQSLSELPPEMLARFTQLDYSREMALIAVYKKDGKDAEIGVARYATNPDGESCEFALVVADEWSGKGLGSRMMRSLMSAARSQGLVRMDGEVLSNNNKMLRLAKRLGFSLHADPDDPGLRRIDKDL
ncbi:MAG: bifunctional acetate--CoA ligase family protein/GNAT family N-acetyltransferase [Chromatiales bacterium]|nr:bifunctional acetate--CoA ligase family protein/GNAT family N-acetyltransferase [Chromatiales bacterium]